MIPEEHLQDHEAEMAERDKRDQCFGQDRHVAPLARAWIVVADRARINSADVESFYAKLLNVGGSTDLETDAKARVSKWFALNRAVSRPDHLRHGAATLESARQGR